MLVIHVVILSGIASVIFAELNGLPIFFALPFGVMVAVLQAAMWKKLGRPLNSRMKSSVDNQN